MEHEEEKAEETVRDLEQQSDEVGEHIDETRKEWERKQRDDAVPGAEPDAEG